MTVGSTTQSDFLPTIEIENQSSIAIDNQSEDGFDQLFEQIADWFLSTDYDQAKESMHALYFRTGNDTELTGHFNQLEELAGEAWKENFQLSQSSEGISRTLDLSSAGAKSIHLEEKNADEKVESQGTFSRYMSIGYGMAMYHAKAQITPQNILKGGWTVANFLFDIPLSPLQKDLVGHSIVPLLSVTSAVVNYFSIDVSAVVRKAPLPPRIWA